MSYKKPTVKSKNFLYFKKTLPSMENKTILITGTTTGTGFVAAQTVAELGAKLIMLNRPSERSKTTHSKIIEKSPQKKVYTIDCDLQSFFSVRKAIEEIIETCPEGIDVICNNAGVMALTDIATEDGYDIQMQTNHISHFLLVCDLFKLLEKTAEEKGESRIVNHSSVARLTVKKLKKEYLEKNGGNLGGNGKSMMFGGARWKRYGQTKFANAAFTAALHEKLQKRGSKIKSLVAHPGRSNTELQVTTIKDGGMAKKMTRFMMKRSQSEEDGAMGILSCICLPEAKSGQFWGPGKGMMAMKGKAKPFKLEKSYNNSKTIKLLWEKSCEAIGKEFVI